MRRALPWWLFAATLIWAGKLWLERWDAEGVADFLGAYARFMEEVARQSCATAPQLRNLAELRGWQVEDIGPPDAMYTADGATEWLRIHIRPEMPFSKEPGARFAFNADGCMIDWHY